MKILSLIFTVFSLSAGVFAQEEPVEPGRLEEALIYIREGSELLRPKKPPLDEVRSQLETKMFYDDGSEVVSEGSGNDFGFGFKRFYYERPGGYCDLYASGFVLYKDYARFRIGMNCGENWKRIREPIIKAWKDASGPAFQEERDGIFSETSNNEIIERYKGEVSKALGSMKPIPVPAKLEKYYNFLIDPLENSMIGTALCVGPGRKLEGRDAIDLFITAKRTDLLENILRGYNPGGRIYASLALFKMEKGGIKLDPKTRDTIERVGNLDSRITVCRGITASDHPGKDVLKSINL
jgi:hypothetical protein